MLNRIRQRVNRWSKRISPVPYVLFFLIAMTGFAAMYSVSLRGGPASAGYFSSADQSGRDTKETGKQAIIQWMKENSDMPEHILAKIYNAAATTGNRDLILAICLVESNFNPHVKSERGAIGLMGIMPGVWLKELQSQGIIQEREDLHKISQNIAAGAHVLAVYLSETNDLRKALIRYVGGASWYASKVLRAQRNIELARNAEQEALPADAQN